MTDEKMTSNRKSIGDFIAFLSYIQNGVYDKSRMIWEVKKAKVQKADETKVRIKSKYGKGRFKNVNIVTKLIKIWESLHARVVLTKTQWFKKI